jgi:ubiquinone/menaquinone biosynthesis C-methylase UbiE
VTIQDPETERVRGVYDRRPATGSGSRGNANLRWLCEQAEGETLEIGIGSGRTLPFYPLDIHLTGIELSGVSLDVARGRAQALGLDVTLDQGDAVSLPYPDDHFDTVVFSFALCTIPDARRAVAEAVRVLNPSGRLLLVEHVRSANPIVRTIERLLEPITLRWMADRLLREPLEYVLAEGLEVEKLERTWLGVVERLAARKPEAEELAEAV